MVTNEIPRAEWEAWCDRFSRDHEGWICTLAVGEAGGVRQTVTEALPFVGVTYDPDRDEMSFTIGDSPKEHLTHLVSAPVRLWVEKDDEGYETGMGTRTADDSTIEVRFSASMPSERLDGIA